MKRFLILSLALFLSLVALASCNAQEEPPREAYWIVIGDATVKIDGEAETILQGIGPWSTYDESPSCAFDGLDKLYGYGAFDLETYPLEDKDYISAIHLNDDTIATREGISVGATRDDVLQAYGTPTEESDSYLRYAASGMTLSFLLKNGTVTNIQYVKNT
ncbi:MAG: hypothetical protein IJX62_00940 [Clostridia bacterium]|nr:hypothetical protein [Clostridia bacterium]